MPSRLPPQSRSQHEPTEAEIREAYLAFQERWTPLDRYLRSGGLDGLPPKHLAAEGWHAPEVPDVDTLTA